MDKRPVNPLSYTPDEDRAMYGLSWAAQLIYLRCIRRYVNYRSGLAGCHDIRLSWQRFRDTIEVIRPSRSKKKCPQDKPSRQFIRERLKELETAGLIVTKPNPKNLPFSVFFLPLTPAGQTRIAEEQPLILWTEKPVEQSRLVSTKSCGVQPFEQPHDTSKQQPQFLGGNSTSDTSNVVELTGFIPAASGPNSSIEQPNEQPQQQPVEQSRLVSAETQGVQQPQQPPKSAEQQPYIYSRKKEIEGRMDLDQKQKERIFLLLDRLVSDPRLHSLPKHESELDTLLFEKELSFDELRDIMNKITDDQYTIKLVAHQLKFIRNKQEQKPAANTKPVTTAKPNPVKRKPDNSVKISEINTELQSLDLLIKNSEGNQALLARKNALQTELDQLEHA